MYTVQALSSEFRVQRMTMNDTTNALLFLALLGIAGLLIDLIPKRRIDWSDSLPSQDDVVKIVGGRQREQPRHLLKLSLLLLVVLGLAFMFGR